MTSQPRIEYIDARRVLLDALTALQAQLDAVVLVGAQAVYLRTAGRLPTYQPFTTDADLVPSPDLLTARPPLGDVMIAAGFVLPGEPRRCPDEGCEDNSSDANPESFLDRAAPRYARRGGGDAECRADDALLPCTRR